MAESSTVEQSPKLKPLEVAAATAAVARRSEAEIGDPAKKAWEKGKKLLELKQKGRDSKAVLEAAKGTSEADFTRFDQSLLLAKYGGGKKEVDPTDRTKTRDKTGVEITPEEKQKFERAQNAMEGIQDVLLWSKIQQEYEHQNRQGIVSKEYSQIITDLGGEAEDTPGHARTAESIKKSALDVVEGLHVTRQLFPELDGMTESARREFLDAAFLTDPYFRQKIVEKLTELSAREMPAIETGEQAANVASAKKKQSDIDEGHTDPDGTKHKGSLEKALDRINSTLETAGQLKIADIDTLKDNLVDLFKDEGAVATLDARIKEQMRLQVLAAQGLADKETQIKQYIELKRQMAEKVKEIASIKTNNNNRAGGAPPRNETKERLEVEHRTLQTAANAIVGEGKPVTPEQLATYNAINDIFNNGLLATEATTIAALGKQYASYQEVIKGAEQNTDALESSRAARLRKEQEMLSDLENVVGNSLIETLEHRYDEMQTYEKERLEEAMKKLRTKAAKDVGHAIRRNWIERSPSGKVIGKNKARVESDMDFLARNPEMSAEESIKRLMLRDLRAADESYRADKNGNPIDTRTYQDHNFSLDNLTDEQKVGLEEAYKELGNLYQKELFIDYYATRGWFFRHGIGGRLMSRDQLAVMEEKFEGFVEKEIEENKRAHEAVSKMEGFGFHPGFAVKWMILALLGKPATGERYAAGGWFNRHAA